MGTESLPNEQALSPIRQLIDYPLDVNATVTPLVMSFCAASHCAGCRHHSG